ncbi:WXG100 family type VII secretion target [Klenkia taihuensis]|jgi:WXG100 family type VII secretion target|uniref:ESAT-6-like protein n=1 Tax=Klenkia taihuensis TaxID=1225127 RepID=A0A1I1ISM4_9ACTN|nr:WXG100 family type VII secretion target [Klenkia taihuensis]GHE14699.1 hypothetical protein GCM10011381_42260 [Klenkia taihuensis]SFC37318.1 WXG100 family type VII secretion target [Klenkia taihuensis]
MATNADPVQMRSFATGAEQTADSIRGMLNSLMGQLSGLESTWKGRGGTSFIQVKSTVETEVNKLHAALTAMGGDIRTAANNYDTGDEEQSSAMQSVQSTTTGITAGLA